MVQAPEVIFLGRIAVDFYGQQTATPLEETRSFARYPGGSSGNMAIAAARAGARVGLISAVGDDPMGRFLLQNLALEGVDTTAMSVHPTRRTALAFLGMLHSEADQLDFYRTDAADTCINAEQVPASYLAEAAYLAVTGTHLADPESYETVLKILEVAASAGAKIVLDVDLRNDLWRSYEGSIDGSVDRVRNALPLVQFIVGNEIELELLLESEPLLADGPTLVRKLGPRGARIEGPNGDFSVPGHSIDVVNPVGAGDAFLGNFLAALRLGSDQLEALRNANAAGALVATRHGCANEMPFPDELALFRSGHPQSDPKIEHLHRTALRPQLQGPVLALACDHRKPFDDFVAATGRTASDASHFKRLVFESMRSATQGLTSARPGMLMDPRHGAEILDELADQDYWIGRPIEATGSRPIEFEAGHNIGAELASWRPGHVAKVLIWYSPDDPKELRSVQLDRLNFLQSACRAAGIEWMLELVPPLDMPRDDDVLCRGVSQCYDAGLLPDWWKLPSLTDDRGWARLGQILEVKDPQCRGVIVLGLNEEPDTLGPTLARATLAECCRGFAIGRTVFADAAEAWFAHQIDDATAVERMAGIYRGLIDQYLHESGGADARTYQA